ncbi:MAG: hypothetical protein OEX00_11305 [Gammaproteobacteria bacterium]|nr:hypothetical protein [Gammaproteobacteria bacterium]MDH5692354.1 hypothetical protein [Gammaproteobacteria bacterium]
MPLGDEHWIIVKWEYREDSGRLCNKMYGRKVATHQDEENFLRIAWREFKTVHPDAQRHHVVETKLFPANPPLQCKTV